MNLKNNIKILSTIILYFSFSLALPMFVALINKEWLSLTSFCYTILLSAFIYLLAHLYSYGNDNKTINLRDGFFIVSLTWVLVGSIAAIPFMLTGTLKDFASAFFESVSGFTTTGSTCFSDVESLPKSILFYRSLTNFLGGMGVIVLFVAIMPKLGHAGLKLTSQESAGTNKDKILPKSKDSAKILWIIYVAIVVLLIVLLLIGGMDLFQSVCIAFSTISTAGFTLNNNSIAYFNSPYIDVVLTIFMYLAAVNFSLFYLTIKGNFSAIVRDGESKIYFFIFSISSLLIALSLTLNKIYPSFLESLRYSAFQYISFLTTTGFTNTDYSNWPLFARLVLFSAYFIGGCQGSTAGGIKIIRLCIVASVLKTALIHKIHPRSVHIAKFNSSVIPSRLSKEVMSFMFAYFIISLISVFLLSLDPAVKNMEQAFSMSLLSIGNVGAGFEVAFFDVYNAFSKIVMCIIMLIGRLEIFTIGVLFTRSYWKN